jgi:integrase
VTWKPKLQKSVPSEAKTWPSNEAMLADFEAFLRDNNYAATVREHYPHEVRVFMELWDGQPLTKLDDADIDSFVSVISRKCAKLQRGTHPRCLVKQPLSHCPLLLGADPETYPSCPGYQALDPAGVRSYLRTLKAFYNWLVDQRAIKHNPVTPVFRRFSRRHKALFARRKSRPRARDWTMDEVKAYVEGTPIQRGFAVALGAKGFCRLHEVMKLTVASVNLQEGWIDIPDNYSYGDKRQGNNRIILDAELRSLTVRLLQWREEHVRRKPDGTPVTDKLVLTTFGKAWAVKTFRGNFRLQLHKDCIRLGLMTGKETQRSQRLNFHGLRALATTWARGHRAIDAELQVLRGDCAPGAIDHYDRFLARLPELYRDYGPQIGL